VHIMAAHARDISEGGICLVGKEQLKDGKMLDLRFSLPGTEDRIHAFGKVARSRKLSEHLYEMGVVFWEIEEQSRSAITQFLDNSEQ
jgi:c-di-GMP-binding flagellar brake protein YcgR